MKRCLVTAYTCSTTPICGDSYWRCKRRRLPSTLVYQQTVGSFAPSPPRQSHPTLHERTKDRILTPNPSIRNLLVFGGCKNTRGGGGFILLAYKQTWVITPSAT
mmetsp:Transcript_27656/g.43520  ORF Transcript_27656/g.43520 Transcript_27656/m.43520 type:complete len:104 (-) Transcript_27656:165-476(-)